MDKLSELLKSVRPATKEELREQGENLAKNYKPGPRQAVPFLPAMEARVEQELDMVQATDEDRAEAKAVWDNAARYSNPENMFIILASRLGATERSLSTAMLEIATLRADGTKAAEELARAQEDRERLRLIATTNAQKITRLRAELARERERHQLAIAKLQQTEPWNNSQHVEDLIDEAIALLEPKAETAPASAAQPLCSVCRKPLFWYEEPEYPQWKHVDRDPTNSPHCWGNPIPEGEE